MTSALAGPEGRRKLPDRECPATLGGSWAEDRATRGRDPSTEPGAKTGVGGRTPPLGHSRDWPESDKSNYIYLY